MKEIPTLNDLFNRCLQWICAKPIESLFIGWTVIGLVMWPISVALPKPRGLGRR